MNVENKLKSLGIELQVLPPCDHPIERSKRSGNLLFVSGHGSKKTLGKVGDTLTVEQGYEAAREACIHCLESIRMACGDLDNVANFVKVLGMVNAAPDFTKHPVVINGVSDLLIEAFGQEIGSHARSAVGMSSLPGGIAVEVEMIVELKN
ncbi:MAG: RidA family protein [Lentisphaerae bacterium]|nr:RidA family protein [Lentisphaerota bacterium]MBQ9803495.1 RidA family protein [Lentisphaeria bacterium]